jgi:hypothetical protein
MEMEGKNKKDLKNEPKKGQIINYQPFIIDENIEWKFSRNSREK